MEPIGIWEWVNFYDKNESTRNSGEILPQNEVQ